MDRKWYANIEFEMQCTKDPININSYKLSQTVINNSIWKKKRKEKTSNSYPNHPNLKYFFDFFFLVSLHQFHFLWNIYLYDGQFNVFQMVFNRKAGNCFLLFFFLLFFVVGNYLRYVGVCLRCISIDFDPDISIKCKQRFF